MRYLEEVHRSAVIRTLLVVAALAIGFGFLVHAVPWSDRCAAAGVTVAACPSSALEPGLRTVLSTMDATLLGAGALVYALGAVCWAWRWQRVLAVTAVRPSFLVLFRASIEAYAAMVLFVGGIGGDAVRFGVLVAEGLSASWATASLAVDRVVGLSALLATGLLVAAPELVALHPVAIVALPALLLALVGGLLVALVAPLPRILPVVLVRIVVALRGPYGAVGARAGVRALVEAFAVSLLVATTQLGAFSLFLAAAHVSVASPAKLVAGIVEAFIVNAIPTVPGGWGTGEAAFVFFLRPAGVGEAQSLAASVAFRLSVLPVAAVGVVSLALRARRKRP